MAQSNQAKKVVRRKAPAPHVEHDVHVVAGDAKPAARTTGKVAAATNADAVAPAEPLKAKPAPKKKIPNTGDA